MKNVLLIVLVLSVSSCFGQRRAYKNINEKDGKVGIGTTTPDEMLTVKGTIHTQEVKVDLEGAVAPDYVFEAYFDGLANSKPDYTMMSLEELAAYLKEFKHLPGVPAATALQEEGLQLKMMNLLLLEKIEELTLYTLQQQKQIETLQKDLEELRNQQ